MRESQNPRNLRQFGWRRRERCTRHSQVGIIQRRPVRRPSFQFKSSKKFPRASYSSPVPRLFAPCLSPQQSATIEKAFLKNTLERTYVIVNLAKTKKGEREREWDDMEEEEPLQPFLRRQRRLSVRNERSRQRRQRPRRTTPTKKKRKSGPK